MDEPASRLVRIAQELRYLRWARWVVLALVGFVALKVWFC
jgi:hypothetical protein